MILIHVIPHEIAESRAARIGKRPLRKKCIRHQPPQSFVNLLRIEENGIVEFDQSRVEVGTFGRHQYTGLATDGPNIVETVH